MKAEANCTQDVMQNPKSGRECTTDHRNFHTNHLYYWAITVLSTDTYVKLSKFLDSSTRIG